MYWESIVKSWSQTWCKIHPQNIFICSAFFQKTWINYRLRHKRGQQFPKKLGRYNTALLESPGNTAVCWLSISMKSFFSFFSFLPQAAIVVILFPPSSCGCPWCEAILPFVNNLSTLVNMNNRRHIRDGRSMQGKRCPLTIKFRKMNNFYGGRFQNLTPQ